MRSKVLSAQLRATPLCSASSHTRLTLAGCANFDSSLLWGPAPSAYSLRLARQRKPTHQQRHLINSAPKNLELLAHKNQNRHLGNHKLPWNSSKCETKRRAGDIGVEWTGLRLKESTVAIS